jgi:hypothetical protein
MSRRQRSREGGFGSLVVVVISMLIAYALITLYLREFTPSGPKGGPAGTLDAVRKQAQSFEEQQRKRFEELQREAAP